MAQFIPQTKTLNLTNLANDVNYTLSKCIGEQNIHTVKQYISIKKRKKEKKIVIINFLISKIFNLKKK